MLTRDGMVPDPAKIEALKKIPEPKNEKLIAKLPRDCKLLVMFSSLHGKFDPQPQIIT